MKKYILSGIVIGSFILYSAYYRISGKSTTVPLPPTDNTNLIPNVIPTISQNVTPDVTPNVILEVTPSGKYKDGTYTGDATDAYYGTIQIQAVISGGKISDVQFLQYPSDRSHSISLNKHAMPILKSEAIKVQGASVDIVSGATATSHAFVKSLQTALNKAI